MPLMEENQEIVDLALHLFDLPKEERIKESLKMQVSTYLTVKAQEEKQIALQEQLQKLPCRENGFLLWLAAMSTTKRFLVSLSAVVIFLVTILGGITGIMVAFK